MSLETMLKDTVHVERQAEVVTNYEKTMTTSTVYTDVPCHIEELSGDLQMTVIGRYPSATHLIFFNADADIKEDDLLKTTAIDYLVLHVGTDKRPGETHHYEVVVEERKKD